MDMFVRVCKPDQTAHKIPEAQWKIWTTLLKKLKKIKNKIFYLKIEPVHDKICNKTCATSEDSEQP